MPTKYYDPTDRRNRWRWRLATLLNRLPRTCWTNIVSWALGDRRLWDRGNHDDIRQNFMCRPTPGTDTCYCGKVKYSDELRS